jgi:hypothetical protein
VVALITPADDRNLKGDLTILTEAAERFQACKDWQGVQDERIREDIKFANGDARNTWQWDKSIYDSRTGEESNLPCLTINNTRVHNDIIINSLSKNGYGIKVRPIGGKASYKSAEVMQSLIRRIEYISKATAAYRKVREQQVDGGIGYILIETAYISERSHDQDIFLKASRDPTGVYLDPWIRETDGSDANFGFVFEKIPRKEFNRKYKKWADKVGSAPIDSGVFQSWITDKEIMVAKYYRKEGSEDTLVSWTDREGNNFDKLESEIREESGDEICDALLADIENGEIDGRTRSVTNNKVKWFLIAGDKIIQRGDWAGKYIPICRCVGRELVIDNTLDLKGHTRALIDGNRMLNYGSSVAVQVVAFQTKSQWLAPARAIEGQEGWKDGNINDLAVATYNDIDDEAQSPELAKIAPPQRIEPPQPAAGWIKVAEDAERHMMMASGQFQAQMGENDTQSAASGKAINERKEQGDTATYHFVEHNSDMLRFIGVQLLDLIPKIYDTKRALQIEDEDGERRWISIVPDQAEALQHLQHEKEDQEAVQLAFNPSIGEYECISDPGPDYATQRQEAVNALSQIFAAQKEAILIGADLFFNYSDFPGADKLRERFEKEIRATKPYLFDQGPPPAVTELQQQLARFQELNKELMQKLAEKQITIRGRDERRDIESFNADTKRLEAMVNAIAKIALTPQQRAQMDHEIEQRAHEHVYSTIESANEAIIGQMTNPDGTQDQNGNGAPAPNGQAPIEGARQAPDGNWYVPDTTRPGKYMMVVS